MWIAGKEGECKVSVGTRNKKNGIKILKSFLYPNDIAISGMKVIRQNADNSPLITIEISWVLTPSPY